MFLFICAFQLRRVTLWTRNDPDMPDVSDVEEDDNEEEEDVQSSKRASCKLHVSSFPFYIYI